MLLKLKASLADLWTRESSLYFIALSKTLIKNLVLIESDGIDCVNLNAKISESEETLAKSKFLNLINLSIFEIRNLISSSEEILSLHPIRWKRTKKLIKKNNPLCNINL